MQMIVSKSPCVFCLAKLLHESVMCAPITTLAKHVEDVHRPRKAAQLGIARPCKSSGRQVAAMTDPWLGFGLDTDIDSPTI